MSLSQRVTSLESLSPERGRSPAGSQRRKLSFSPLPGNWGDELEREQHVAEEIETVAAFEVSKGKRIGKSCWCWCRHVTIGLAYADEDVHLAFWETRGEMY